MANLIKFTEQEREFKNSELKKVYDIAKSKGYKVFTFESDQKYINQIFIENKEGKVGSCSEYYSGVKFSTIHKSLRGSGNGTGFGGLIKGEDFNSPEDIDICFISFPYWAGNREKNITKYTSFDDYIKNSFGILKYYEIKK